MGSVRWLAGVLCVCVFSTVAVAEGDLAELQAKKKELVTKQKELQNKERALVREVSASKELDKARRAVAETRADYDDAKATDSKLKKTREAQREAEQELRELIAEKVADTDESKDTKKTLGKLNEELRELHFKRGLIDLELGHRSSPIMREAMAEKSVKKAREKLAEVEAEIRSKPAKEVVAARKAYAEARAKADAINAKIGEDRKLKAAMEDENEARAELGEAERDDKRRAALSEAEKEQREARAEAFKDIRKARPLLEEIDELTKEYNEKRADVRAIDRIIDTYRKALRDGTAKDRGVAKAVKAVEEAKKDYEKTIDSWTLGKLKKAVDEARKTFDEKHEEFFGKHVDYVALTAKEKAERAKLDALIKEATSAKKLAKALPEMRKIMEELGSLSHQKRDIRIANPKWDAIYQARGRRQRELDLAVDKNDKASEQRAELQAAQRALDNAVEEALRDIGEVEDAMELKAEIMAEMAELEFKKAMVEYKVYNGNSEIAREANADKKVLKLRAKCNEIRNDIRNDPTRAVQKAREAYNEARADTGKIRSALHAKEKYAEADAARRQAERDLRSAEADDPRRKELVAARDAVQAAINEAIGDIRKAESLREDRAELTKKIEAIEAEKKSMSDKMRNVQRSIERGEDKDVAKARKEIAEAKKEVAAAENSEKLQELMKEHNEARAALAKETKELVAEDSKVQKVRKELGEVNTAIGDLDKQIREMQKAARKKAKPAKKPKKKAEKKAKKEAGDQ